MMLRLSGFPHQPMQAVCTAAQAPWVRSRRVRTRPGAWAFGHCGGKQLRHGCRSRVHGVGQLLMEFVVNSLMWDNLHPHQISKLA